MSLIILGKVSSESKYEDTLREQMSGIASHIDVSVVLDQLDPEDMAVLEEIEPSAEKFYFIVNTSVEENEASSLWNEANLSSQRILRESMGERFVYTANAVPDAEWPDDYIDQMKHCRLARFLYLLAGMQGYRSICIALIDGGIESEFRGTAEECIEEILRMVLLPWDNSPNTLYIWKRPDKETGGSSE